MPKWHLLLPLLIIFTFSGFYSVNNHTVVAQSVNEEYDESTPAFFRANANRTGYFDKSGPVNDKVEKLWSFKTENRRIEASPIVYDSTLYLSSRGDHLYAIDITTGIEKWRSDSTGFFRSSATVSDRMIYIGNEDHHLYAFNLDGSVKWTFKTEGSVRASPLVSNDMVYFGSIDNEGYARFDYKRDSVRAKSKFYALDAQSGEEIWHFSPEGGLRSSAAYYNEVVYFGSWDGNIYALNAKNGDLIWSFATEGKIYSTPAVESNSVIFASNDEFLYSLNAEDGSKQWSFNLKSHDVNEWIPRISSSAVTKDAVFIGSLNGNLYSIDLKDGTLRWSFETVFKIVSSLSVANDVVYFGSDDSYVYALQTSDGSLVWKYKTDVPIGTSSPYIQDGKLYIGTVSNEIISLE